MSDSTPRLPIDGTPSDQEQGADPPTLLRTENVSKVYQDGQVRALDGVSMELCEGEYASIMGPSGSGKSTLLNILGALDRPTAGEVFFKEQPLSAIKNLDRFRSQQLGFVFQSFHLLPVLSAVENVQIPMFETDLSAARRAQRAEELLELVGLSHRARHLPKQLSVGERQRVAIARSLANKPALLLADEPTGNLDSKTAASVFELFEQLHGEHGMTILLITHDPHLAECTQRVIRMQDGKVVPSEP